MTDSARQVALVILYQQGRFLMQLRDDIPGIAHPGVWGFFGGHIEAGESPLDGASREVIEEINYTPSQLCLFRCFSEKTVIRHVFYGALTVDLDQLTLTEGWDMGLLTLEQIKAGEAYSQKAAMVRALGRPHQKILLDFIEFAQGRSLKI